ncbi:hypothetical protein VPHD148_0075 [Vibrio phage D148]
MENNVAKKLTKLVSVKQTQFNRMLRKIEDHLGFLTVKSDGSYRLTFGGRERVIGVNGHGMWLNVNLLDELGYELI